MFRYLILLLLSVYAVCVCADQPLPPNEAFQFSSYYKKDAQQIVLEWKIAPGYFLYRDKLRFSIAPADKIGRTTLPMGRYRQDTLHGKYQVFLEKVSVNLPLNTMPGIVNLTIHYQGCSAKGFCYTPIEKKINVDLSQLQQSTSLLPYIQSLSESNETATTQPSLTKLFDTSNLIMIMFSFLGLGLLLAFTPCVLPMVPILSGIILGRNKNASKAKAFRISLAYVLGMALTYALAGIVIALIGSNLQAELQRPWIIVLFSGIFVLLALSLFGFFELQIPSTWQNLINRTSNRQKSGSYVGVFIMGCLSTLIVSPCVSAPLIGVLAYIGQTGDVVLGGLALLSLGIGMGIPLLLLGVSADRILPKAGPWMEIIERFFGIAMLGIAIWMLSRMIPGPVTLFLWSLLCIFAAIYLDIFSSKKSITKRISQILGVFLLIYGVMLMIGAMLGNDSLIYPWQQFQILKAHRDPEITHSPFVIIKNDIQLTGQLALAEQSNKLVMLDFYADWCTSCVVMDHAIFNRAPVQQALQNMVMLRADITQNNPFDRKLLKQFHVVGPPTILFFKNGEELNQARIIGEVNAETFLQRIEKIRGRISDK